MSLSKDEAKKWYYMKSDCSVVFEHILTQNYGTTSPLVNGRLAKRLVGEVDVRS